MGWKTRFALLTMLCAVAPLAASEHWSLKPRTQPTPPVIKSRWIRNPIDAFVLAKLEANKLQPNKPADKITLLRRVTIDLTGLLPTPEETQAFVNDNSPGAYDRVIDRLLASPAYGERWGRHWLDVARYADSNGYKADERVKLMKLLWDCMATEFGGRHELYEINYGGSTEEIRRYALFGAQASGNADRFKGFAEECMAEYDINGWRVPDLTDPGELSYHVMRGKG